MSEIKMNSKGQITIPKAIREKYGWFPGVTLEIGEDEKKIEVAAAFVCHRCGRVLPDALKKHRGLPRLPAAQNHKGILTSL